MRVRRIGGLPAVLLAWSGSMITGAAAQEMDVALVRLTDRVTVARPAEPGIGNVTVLVEAAEALVVDAGFPSVARHVQGALDGVGVRFVVNTHWHDDHLWGNQVFREAHAGADFIAHEHTRADVLNRAIPGLADNLVALERAIAEREAVLTVGREGEGPPLTPARYEALATRLAQFRGLYDDLRSIQPVVPNLTFDDRVRVFLGALEVQVIYLGPGNTRGDAVVYVPGERVVIAGDMLTHPIPAQSDFLPEWTESLRRLAALEFDVLVPGHGAIQRDRAYLDATIALFESVVHQVRDAVARGWSADHTREVIELTPFVDAFGLDDAVRAQGFDRFFLDGTVASLHARFRASK